MTPSWVSYAICRGWLRSLRWLCAPAPSWWAEG